RACDSRRCGNNRKHREPDGDETPPAGCGTIDQQSDALACRATAPLVARAMPGPPSPLPAAICDPDCLRTAHSALARSEMPMFWAVEMGCQPAAPGSVFSDGNCDRNVRRRVGDLANS